MNNSNQVAGGPPAPDGSSSALAVGVVEAVTRSLTDAATTGRPLSPEDKAETQAIADAMIRLLIGIPLRSDGQLTVKSLAEEACLRRNKLTHKHTGLKDLFYALVRAQQGRPKLVDGLVEELGELKSQLERVRAERDALKAQVKQLARIVHVLEVESQQIRESADHDNVVRVMPQRRAGPGQGAHHRRS